MTKYLSLLAIICSLHLISYLKADYPQRIDSFPVFLMQFLTHDVLRTCLQHAWRLSNEGQYVFDFENGASILRSLSMQ